MQRPVALAGAAVVAAGLLATSAPSAGAAADTPLWVTHVQKYPGGISAGVRASLTAGTRGQGAVGLPAAPATRAGNRQISIDSDPPLPQNETAVAASLDNPSVAVAAANDYVNGGVQVMRTSDGGRSWRATYVVPVFAATRDTCSGGDPAVAYSKRDHVFYLSQLCFFRTLPYSEVQVYSSKDNGRTWTPGRQAAVAATNYRAQTGETNDRVFNDKEYIAVDNTPSSPHYGRLYVTYTKFHMRADGFSDYCPIKLSFTDRVNLDNPQLTTFRQTDVMPDNPGGNGVGRSANQFSVPVVEPNGALDIGFVQEECNSSYDPHLLFQRSTDGGRTFLRNAVQIDKPGQYRDFLNGARDDTLPPTAFRAPNTISMVWSRGVLTYAYQNNVDRRRSGANISVQRSADGGRHWSDMQWLSKATTGGPARNDQFMPWLATSGDGAVYAIWFDRRRDPANVRIDTWEAHSANDGSTWSSRRISTESWNPARGFFTSASFIGDYNGLAVSRTHVYPVWADGRNSAIDRTTIGETDIFTDYEPR